MLVSSDVTQTTWNSRLTGTLWGTAGCLGDGVDRVSTVIASASVVFGQTAPIDLKGAGLDQAVQDIINGTSTVFWFEIEHINDTAFNGDAFQMLGQAHADGLRPTLFVTYSPSSIILITEPVTLLDANSASFIVNSAVTEPATTSDSSTNTLLAISSINEPATLADSNANTLVATSAVSEAITAIDTNSARAYIR